MCDVQRRFTLGFTSSYCSIEGQVFAVLINKAKIVEEVKHSERKRRDSERAQGKVRKDSSPFSFVLCPKRRARSDGPLKTKFSVPSNEILRCVDYKMHHPNECWRKSGVFLHCGSKSIMFDTILIDLIKC